MSAFFIPGITGGALAVESAYGEMCRQTERELGHRPTSRRIVSLWTRRGAVDCITEVGRLDPLCGGTVIAIFDLGPHRPFVVWRQQQPGSGDAVSEVLGCNAYAVLEFDA